MFSQEYFQSLVCLVDFVLTLIQLLLVELIIVNNLKPFRNGSSISFKHHLNHSETLTAFSRNSFTYFPTNQLSSHLSELLFHSHKLI